MVSGTGAGSAAVLQAAANVALALHARGKAAEICLVVPEVNSLGVALLQAAEGGRDLETAFAKIERGEADTLVVLENDLYRRAERPRIDALLAKVRLIVIDHRSHATADQAAVVLSAGAFAESDGTVVNNEGRAQRYFQVYDPAYYDPQIAIRESWAWLMDLRARHQHLPAGWGHFDDVTAAVAQAVPALGGIVNAAPNAKFRLHGLKIAREPHRYSGRTAMRANLSVHEPRQPQDADTPLAFSMEGHNGTQAGERPGALIPFAWAPGWNSPQSWNKFQAEVGGALQGGDPGVRLIEPTANGAAAYTRAIPAAFAVRAGEWLVLPLAHIFGSDELSALSAPLASLIPTPYLALNPADADDLGLGEAEEVGGATATGGLAGSEPGAAGLGSGSASPMLELTLPGGVVRLAVRHRADQPRGTVGLPAGLPGMPWFATGIVVELGKGAA